MCLLQSYSLLHARHDTRLPSSHVGLDRVAVPREPVVVPRPEHDAPVLGGVLDHRQHLRHEVARRHEPAASGLGRGGEAEEHPPRPDGRPLRPRLRQAAHAGARAVLARRVVVELHPHVVEQPRGERGAQRRVRERALRRRRQVHGPPRAPAPAPGVGLEEPGQVVPVHAPAALDVEVDAVEDGVAEGPGLGPAAAEVVVPEVRRDAPGVGPGREAVAADAPADGEQDLDAHALARLDVRAHARAPAARRVAVARQVQRRRLAPAERREEGHVDEPVVARGAGLRQRPLVAVLAPVDGDAAAGARCGGYPAQCHQHRGHGQCH
uniref:Uncharacterized protein n=1 Tax=Zea mays TaxID=4577 RepID=C0PF09_MAIZE|nr:unknown [Zea mays]